MRIWMQLVASPARLPNFVAALQEHADSVADPSTEVVLRGTKHGALGDHFATFLHFDADDILRGAYQEVRGQDYAVYALANSLDPALHALRESLDIPVLSLMQVGCSVATMLADRIGLIVPNRKFAPTYTALVESYGFGGRLAAVRPLTFDRIADLDLMFIDEQAAARSIAAFEAVAEELAAEGAEAVLAPGPLSCLLARRQISDVAGMRVIDLYGTLVKVSESVAYLAAHCGMNTSRTLTYQQPPAQIVQEAQRLYGL